MKANDPSESQNRSQKICSNSLSIIRHNKDKIYYFPLFNLISYKCYVMNNLLF